MKYLVPRITLAGTNSSCGKTTITIAIIKAMVNRGLNVNAFKCGPDYIDPMFHKNILGVNSTNLDSFFFDDNTMKYLLGENGKNKDINIIEGVMGFYDGIDLTGLKGSTYDISNIIESPVVLVINAKGAALSNLATIKGFLELYPKNNICGVIFNKCTAMTYSILSKAIDEHFKNRINVLGYMPEMKDCSLESRRLGLITASEVENLKNKIDMLGEQAKKSIDLDGLLKIASAASKIEYDDIKINNNKLKYQNHKIRIGVAKDEAFCFYYDANLKLFEELGAEIVEFSPLRDKKIPNDIDGIYLGGGYPELYAKKLSENNDMKASIKSCLEHEMPCIAECGGFMYLNEYIDEYKMVGYFRGRCYDSKKLQRFGYITIIAKDNNMLCKKGEKIAAHEFHYWDSTDNGMDFEAIKKSGKTWDCIHANSNIYAGYPHFHFYSNMDFAINFYNACVKEKIKNDRKH